MDYTHINIQSNATVFSVQQLSDAIKNTVEGRFSAVSLRGEISGFKHHTSGHGYFCLKDEIAVIDAVCWRGTLSQLQIQPQDGMDVICEGRVTTYGARSKYQIIITKMVLAGQGALLKLLEERKQKFIQEGLFDLKRKKTLPFMPRCIGVITSETGAVIRDILHRLSDRCPTHVILWPVPVQGEGAAFKIAQAIQNIQNLENKPDVIIVARGGGSLEDLWAFNEEIVVRAVSACAIPVISAVGHETDTTLIDYVADQRAPTPTAAAEIAVPVYAQLQDTLNQTGDRLIACIKTLHIHKAQYLYGLARGLLSPQQILNRQQEKCRLLAQHMDNLYKQTLREGTHKVTQAHKSLRAALPLKIEKLQAQYQYFSSLLDSFSYEHILKRGFTLTKTRDGRIIKSKDDCPQDLTVLFHNGAVDVSKT